MQTIAAGALGAAVVRTGASVQVDLFLAFHFSIPFLTAMIPTLRRVYEVVLAGAIR